MTDIQEVLSISNEVVEELNRSEWGSEWAKPSSNDPRLRPQLQAILRHLSKGQTLLDIGTGFGIIPEVFHRFGCKVISVDFPKTGGTAALSRLIEKGVEGHYAEVGAERLPLDDGSVDVVFVGDVIEHLPHSPKLFMSDVVRILKPGGYAVLTTPNSVRLEMRLKVMLGGSPWPALASYYDDDVNCHHHKEYTESELKRLVELSGLELVEFRFYDMRYDAALKRAIHGILLPILGLRPAWKSEMLAVGHKPDSRANGVARALESQ